MRHFSPDELAQWRADLPGHWFVEVVSGDSAALIAIPASEAAASREIASLPGVTPDLLDGGTMHINLTGESHGQPLQHR